MNHAPGVFMGWKRKQGRENKWVCAVQNLSALFWLRTMLGAALVWSILLLCQPSWIALHCLSARAKKWETDFRARYTRCRHSPFFCKLHAGFTWFVVPFPPSFRCRPVRRSRWSYRACVVPHSGKQCAFSTWKSLVEVIPWWLMFESKGSPRTGGWVKTVKNME